MKNFSKILCVVLALVMALSVAACSMSKQYAYKENDTELPIGVYIYYLRSAYSQAEGFAQKSDLYDSETGKYDGKDSFLKMEITDDDGNTAVAEQWIKDKAEKDTKLAIATYLKAKELNASTIDQTELDSVKSYYKSYWDQSLSADYETYGVSFDSFMQIAYLIPVTESNAFKAQYAADGPTPVTDDELSKYFTDNYTSYKYFSVNLYETATADEASEETSTESVPLSEDKIAAYQKEFDGYAKTLSSGGSYDDVIADYMKAHDITEDPTTSNVEVIDKETTDQLMKAILGMKDGQAMTIEIGETDTTKQLYVLYREPIANQLKAYTDPEQHRDDVLSSMKHEEFDELLEKYIEEKGVKLSSDCGKYNPSMFEAKK